MTQHDPVEQTDYRQHTDDELREAIAKAEREQQRLQQDGSASALDAARRQRDEMQDELDRRGA